MQALVTGGAGFIGSTLVDRLLAEDWRVDVVDDLSTGSLAQPRRRAGPSRTASLVPPARPRVAGRRRPDHPPQAGRDLPSGRADGRARLGGASGVRRDGQRHRLAERLRRRGRGRSEEGRLRGFGRHALRHARSRSRPRRARRNTPSRRTASPRRRSASTSTTTASNADSSTRCSPSRTCTDRARTRTAKPGSSRSSRTSCSIASSR